MSTDPSWLYSTIAQSSAAIVAIVGGFITATVLMLTSEKRSLSHQQAEKKTRLGALKAEEERLSDVYETMRVDRFFKAIADDLKKEEKLPSLETLMRSNPGWHLEHEILKREYEKLSMQKLEARSFIEQHSDKIDPRESLLFEEWVRENELDISPYDDKLLEEEYYRFRKREEEILEEERRKTVPPQLRGIFDIPMSAVIPLSPGLTQQRTQYELYHHQRNDRILEEASRRVAGIRHEIHLVESEISNLEGRIKAFSYPPHLGWGLVILACFAFSGIVLPIMVIMIEMYSTQIKQFIFILFFLGLAAMFGYIAFQLRESRR